MIRLSLLLVMMLSTATATAATSSAGTPPEPLTRAEPVYPDAELQARHEGSTVVAVKVTKAGTVHSVLIDRSSGFPALDQAALEAVKQWTFLPATDAAGKAVEGDLKFPVTFKAPPPAPNQADMQKAIDAVMKRPCSDVNKEVADYLAAQPNADVRQLKLFKLTSGIVFIAAGSQAPDVREAIARKLPAIYVEALAECATKPTQVYGDSLNKALADNAVQ